MYVIIVYDVSIERVNKVRAFLRRYLKWVQNSVFEGELTPAEYEKVKYELSKMISTQDSIILYKFRTEREVNRETIGSEKGYVDILI